MLKDFQRFNQIGNLLTIAEVGVKIAAFGVLLLALFSYLIAPFFAMFLGRPDFASITLGPFEIGAFLDAVLQVAIVATFCLFVIAGARRFFPSTTTSTTPSREEQPLIEIRDLLKERQQ